MSLISIALSSTTSKSFLLFYARCVGVCDWRQSARANARRKRTSDKSVFATCEVSKIAANIEFQQEIEMASERAQISANCLLI